MCWTLYVRVFILVNFICIFFVSVTESKELTPTQKNTVCVVYARQYADLSLMKSELAGSTFAAVNSNMKEVVVNIEELGKVEKLLVSFQNKLESICPGTGYKCETYPASPKRNVCKSFQITTSHTFVFEDLRYE